MNIFFRELRANRRSLILWSLGILFMIAASMGKYAASVASGQSIADVMDKMPAALQAIFGVGLLDYSKASGFYAMIYLYLMLMAAIHASMLGAVILSKEERDRTSEFLFVKPVTRADIITSKLLAALTNVIILNIVTWVTSALFVGYYANGEDLGPGIAKLMLGLLLVQLLFLAIGAASAAILKRPKGSTGITTAVVLSAFLLSIAIDVNGKIDALKVLSPFKYFDPKKLLYGQSMDWGFLALTIVLTALLTAGTYFFFKRRDIRV